MEWSFFFFYVWYTVDDAKDGCFSSLCMEKLFGDTLFFILEYGASLFDVANLEGKKYLHFWGCWEICWFFEVFASWDIGWVISYLGFYTMYFHIWFLAFCFCFSMIFLYLFQVQSVHHREHDILFYWWNIYYLSQKKKAFEFTNAICSIESSTFLLHQTPTLTPLLAHRRVEKEQGMTAENCRNHQFWWS